MEFRHSGEPIEDLMQVASIALLRALTRFDPNYGTAFTSYAIPTIRGHLRRHLRDHGWAIKPPRHLQERSLAVVKATRQLFSETGHAPTVAEIAHHTNLSIEATLEAHMAAFARFAGPLPHAADETPSALTIRVLGRTDDGYQRAEDRATIDQLVRSLPPQDRMILRLRFEEDLTQHEIAALLGVSQMQISRILKRLITKLQRITDPQQHALAAECLLVNRRQIAGQAA